MFRKVRLQLLGSYLMVLAGIMVVFAISIRTTFAYTLHHQVSQRLQNLVKAGSLELEIEDGRLELDQEDLVRDLQSLQWYDPTGQLVGTQGQPASTLPLDPQHLVRLQTHANLQSWDLSTAYSPLCARMPVCSSANGVRQTDCVCNRGASIGF